MNALQRAVDTLNSDTCGPAIVDEIFNKIERTKSDVDGLIRQVFGNKATRFLTVRRVITRLENSREEFRRDIDKAAGYIRFVAAIVDRQPHLDHLSTDEWRVLVQFLCGLEGCLPSEPERLHIKVATDIFRCLYALLGHFEAADESTFYTVLDAVALFTDGREETSAHPSAFGCIRLIYLLSSPQFHSTATYSRNLGLAILERGPFRNAELKVEAFAFHAMLGDEQVSLTTIDSHLSNMEGCEIVDTNVEFSPAASCWTGTRKFRARSLAPLTGFLASKSLSVLLTNAPEPHTSKLTWLTRNSDRCQVVLQALCFIEFELASSDVHTLLSLNLRSGEWFWALVLIAVNGIEFLKIDQLLGVWRAAADRLHDPRCSSAASFCLAQCIGKLAQYNPLETDLVQLLLSLLWQMSTGPLLSSGSLHLYREIKNLRILDVKLHEHMKKLDEWLIWQTKSWIGSSSGTGYNLELLSAITGDTYSPIYTGGVHRISQEFASFHGTPNWNQTATDGELLSFLPAALSLDTPANEKLLMWLAIVGRKELSDSQIEYFESRPFKNDMESMVLYARTVDHTTRLHEVAAMADSWPCDDDFDYLVHRAKQTLDPGSLLVENFLYQTELRPSETLLDVLGSRVLASYSLQRNREALEQIAKLLNSFKEPHRTKKWFDLKSFVLSILGRHSLFSRLRLSFAALTKTAEELCYLIRGSCDNIALQMACFIKLSHSLYDHESEVLSYSQSTENPRVRDAFYLEMAAKGGDLSEMLFYCATYGYKSSILCLSQFFGLSPKVLLSLTGEAVLERWASSGIPDPFPYNFFAATPDELWQLQPLKYFADGAPLRAVEHDVPRHFTQPAGIEPVALKEAAKMVLMCVKSGKRAPLKRKRANPEVESWATLLLLKSVPLIRLRLVDWKDFQIPQEESVMAPEALDSWLPDFCKVSAESAEWVIEQILKDVGMFAAPGRIYLAIRRCYFVYLFCDRPASALKTFLRGVVLVEHPSLHEVIVHLLHLVQDELDPVLASEVACSVSEDLREMLRPYFVRFSHSGAETVILFLYELRPDLVFTVLEGDFPTLDLELPFHRALFSRLELYDVNKLPPFNDSKRGRIMVSNLLGWAQKINLSSQGFSIWAAKFIAIMPRCDNVHEKEVLADDPNMSIGQIIYSHVKRHDYGAFRWLIPFLCEFPAAHQLFPGHHQIIPRIHPSPRYPQPSSVTDLNANLSCIFDCYSLVPLNNAHHFFPGLAEDLMPSLYQGLLTSNANSAASLMANLEKLIPSCPNVKKIVVRGHCRAYLDRQIPYEELSSLQQYAQDLGMGAEALLFTELLYDRSKALQLDTLANVGQIIGDADIVYGLQCPESLATAASGHDPWRNLQVDVSGFEVNPSAGAGSLYQSFRGVGMLRLANMIQLPSLHDYESAWKLQQWDLPPPKTCKTESQVLFNLFRQGQEWNFDSAYFYAFKFLQQTDNISTLRVLQEIEQATKKTDFVDASSENARLGREIVITSQGSALDLARELSQSCVSLREKGDLVGAMSCTLKLENLAKSPTATAADHVGLVSLIESARTSWHLGNQSGSISILKRATESNLFLTGESSLFDASDVLCTLAQWTSEAKSEPDGVIEKDYLETAISRLSQSNSDLEFVYHTFAKFCDDRYRDPTFIREIKEAKRLVTSRDGKQKALKERIRQAPSGERKLLEVKYSRDRALLETEYHDYQVLMQRRLKLVSQALKYYLESLSVGKTHTPKTTNELSRVVSLWLSHANSSEINHLIRNKVQSVPVFKWIPWLNQLTSCLAEDSSPFQNVLYELIYSVCSAHPYHSLWFIQALTQGSPTDARAASRNAAGTKLWNALASKESLVEITYALRSFCTEAVSLSAEKVVVEERPSFTFRKLKNRRGRWWRESLPALKVPIPTRSILVRPDGNYIEVPVFRAVEPSIGIASGISAPKIVRATDSWGDLDTMLFKDSKDDIRQDVIMEQVFGRTNDFFARDREARKRNLAVRTYNVVSLSPTSGVIEFVTNTKSLLDILDPLHRQRGGDPAWNAKRARETMRKAYSQGKEGRVEAFQEICENMPPVMRYFFFEKFRRADTWLAARSAYSRSAAASSIVGHILGLGDRHCSNILLDVATGEMVHIDLGIAFDQGKALRVPETVPFRLSRDVVDGFGSTGYRGIFSRCAEITLTLLRNQQDDIFTILDVLLYDPLYQWRVSPLRGQATQQTTMVSKQTTHVADAEKPESDEAERALRSVRKKLAEGLSVEATVRELIRQATSLENLALIYEGWAPFY